MTNQPMPRIRPIPQVNDQIEVYRNALGRWLTAVVVNMLDELKDHSDGYMLVLVGGERRYFSVEGGYWRWPVSHIDEH